MQGMHQSYVNRVVCKENDGDACHTPGSRNSYAKALIRSCQSINDSIY